MSKSLRCHLCHKIIKKKPSDVFNKKLGRPYKYSFCDTICYNRWRANQHLKVKERWLKFQREVWGTIPVKRFQVDKAKPYGREAEILARDVHLPNLGFKNIVDFSGQSNQFFVDFVADFNGQKVLIDATIKLKAYIPKKMFLAQALGMSLFIIHVSPKNKQIFYLSEVTLGRKVSRVPAKFIRGLAKS